MDEQQGAPLNDPPDVETPGSPADADPFAGAPAARPLPGDVERTPLPERVVPYWRVSNALGWSPFCLIALAIALAVPGLPTPVRVLIFAVPLLLAALEIVVVTPRRRAIWWYAIADEQIDLEHGWLVVTRTVVPMTRVQHVEVEHGPLAQRFDLAQLEIHTAAGSVKIPALDRGEADRIRQRIADLARIADDL